jgi:rhamnulokinase
MAAQTLNFCALDLGAGSGRVMLGQFDGERITLSEKHRFASAPALLPDGLFTDSLHIWSELKAGLAIAAQGTALAGIGVDTWGVDFAFLDKQGGLLANPRHYRDRLTDGILDKAFERVPKREIFWQTGVQFMPINTLFQLYALKLSGSPLPDAADRLLMTPDLFNYWLCGSTASEFTIATTSQCFNPLLKTWAWPLIEKFGIPPRLFGPIVQPGSLLAPLRPEVAEETGIAGKVPVIAPGCHDTALAVAAVPATEPNFAYISCGTWSLLGTELDTPCINDRSLAGDFTNEGGVAGTTRFLKNLTGLWILEECRRAWSRSGEDYSYAQLSAMAAAAAPLVSLIDPADDSFSLPGDMPECIRAFCLKTGQPLPEGKGEFVRCILESLALSYRKTLDQLEGILGMRLNPIHLVGGGSRNALLCAFAANATGRTVVAGPVEATATGNILMQAIALKQIGSLAEGRAIVRTSFETTVYEPRDRDRWEEACARFARL